MWVIIYGVLGVFLLHFVVNGFRNHDPLNRKCAAEICEYLTTSENLDPVEIQEIFKGNARYRKQANHIVSMVPVLLIKAGYSKEMAMSLIPLLKVAAMMQPR